MRLSQFQFHSTGAASVVDRFGAVVLLLVLLTWINSLLPAFSQTNLTPAHASEGAATGPTLRLEVGRDDFPGNPMASFMYFVPLISPEPVTFTTSPGSTQTTRVLSTKRKSTAHSFVVTCEFEFAGKGSQQSLFDLARIIRQHERQLKAGGSTGRRLSSILVEGPGNGLLEVEGIISNNVETVTEVRVRFNARGKASPVSIGLCEVRYREGEFRRFNEIVARVNTLTFRRKPGPPKMEVGVASVKPKGAGNGLWQNLKGSIKGMAANLLIDPLKVRAVGHQAMLDFGAALASGAPTFTFPRATNLSLEHSSSTVSNETQPVDRDRGLVPTRPTNE